MAKKLVIFAGENTLWVGTPPKRREGATELLCGLGCERTIVSAGDPREQARVLNVVGLEMYFTTRWFCRNNSSVKRDVLQQLLDDAVRRSKVIPAEVFCVGDGSATELFIASQLGMSTVFIQNSFSETPLLFGARRPNHRITHLRELLSIG